MIFLFFLGASCSAPPAPPAPNQNPVANAGPDQTVDPGDRVDLDGSSSFDPDEDALTYSWSTAANNPALVFVSQTASFSFTPLVSGTYWFSLTVSDDTNFSPPDSVKITVSSSDNNTPLADAGPGKTIVKSSQILLDGSGSTDPDGDLLSYLWEFVSTPQSAQVEFDDATAQQPKFTALVNGDYRIRLTVSDGEASATEEISIIIQLSNVVLPIADAGRDTQVVVGTQVTLDASGSTEPVGNNALLSFHWTIGRTPGAAVSLSDSTAVQPTFVPAEPGDYVFGLVVDNGSASSLQDVVTITVTAPVFAEQGGMIEIPAGSFKMGSELGAPDESPEHQVSLSVFWIDKFEVTAGTYQGCVDAQACSPTSTTEKCNAGREDRAQHPINCVDWEQARSYCEWAGKRLPTEAEWEKAARGTDGRRFPWGNASPNPGLLNYGRSGYDDTQPVDTYEAGESFYKVHNMGGNVSEWTADYFAFDYYANSRQQQDPQGPAAGDTRVVRGSSWKISVPTAALTATVRQRFLETTSDNSLGFRCARTDPPP